MSTGVRLVGGGADSRFSHLKKMTFLDMQKLKMQGI